MSQLFPGKDKLISTSRILVISTKRFLYYARNDIPMSSRLSVAHGEISGDPKRPLDYVRGDKTSIIQKSVLELYLQNALLIVL